MQSYSVDAQSIIRLMESNLALFMGIKVEPSMGSFFSQKLHVV